MKTYRTAEIAKIIGIHPNTVRLYEKWGADLKARTREKRISYFY